MSEPLSAEELMRLDAELAARVARNPQTHPSLPAMPGPSSPAFTFAATPASARSRPAWRPSTSSFLTGASEPVKSVHPKAMPVILTRPDEIEIWVWAPWEEAQALQRPLKDGSLVNF